MYDELATGEIVQKGDCTMLIDGLFNVLNFIVSPSDQPQKFIAFVGVVLLVNVLIAVLDLKWGRGIAFTVLAATFYRKKTRKPSTEAEG
jgi:hypothetical protein